MLIPHVMEGRDVRRGVLGCPVCLGEFPIEDGVVEFGRSAAMPPPPPSPPPDGTPEASAVLAFLGLEGPGGYLALIGDADRYADGVAAALPGVHLVLVNPATPRPAAGRSIVRAPRWPLRARSLRGAVVGDAGLPDVESLREAVRAVLPGLRITGAGEPPAADELELLGRTAGWWVGTRR